VGNCVNALTLAANCGFPLLMLVTLRGEWGEFNPWQVPMGQVTPEVLRLAGVCSLRLDRAEEAFDTVAAASKLAFDSYAAVAVLIAQRLIGTKSFGEKP
jgi:sulfopyruvate decarboxylase TPP-binding subunit